MKSNIYYFEVSIKKEEILEERYMCLGKDKKIKKYFCAAEEIDLILEKIHIQRQHDGKISDELLEEFKEILDRDTSDKNRFNCFLNACDSTEETIKKDKKLLKKVIELYLDNRNIAANESEDWIQALIDKGASRKFGKVGEQKIFEMAEAVGFVGVDNWETMRNEDYAVAYFKKGVFDLKNIRTQIGAEMPFKMQEKMLDIILKSRDKYVFVEAKHIKESGGSQDKQIKELIDTILVDDKNQNISYAAFLDGVYSNVLIGDIKVRGENIIELDTEENTKIKTQKHDIIENLNTHKRSYFKYSWL